MTCDQIFHLAGGQAMAGDVNHVVGATHDVDEAVFIQITAVTGVVVAGKRLQVRLQITRVIAPEGLTAARWQRQGNDDGALLVGTEQLAVFVQHADVIAGHGTVA